MKNNEAGFAHFILIIFLLFMGLFACVLFIKLIGSSKMGANGNGANSFAHDNDNNGTGNSSGDSNNNGTGTYKDDDGNLGTGGLVCVNIPGINYPRTPALDRRVARAWRAVRQDLDAQGIGILTGTWAYRTYCQQVNVDSGGNLKAQPGTSPHEGGRAIDFGNLRLHPQRSQIIATFVRHGWVHLGARDWPHVEMKGYSFGEPSHIALIQKTHADFKNGNPKGCRGTDCGQ